MATKKVRTDAAVEAAATQQPTDRDPSADVQAGSALAEPNTDASDGDALKAADDAVVTAEDNAEATKEGSEVSSSALQDNDLTDANKGVAGLIPMHRDVPLHENGPTTADVHPAEVEHWLAYGWLLSPDIAGTEK